MILVNFIGENPCDTRPSRLDLNVQPPNDTRHLLFGIRQVLDTHPPGS